uniref:Uncharacterized protein n=1 Tax=Arion vulgaris TaxID=1028688 RepID=A0A0B7A6C3_9EUPU
MGDFEAEAAGAAVDMVHLRGAATVKTMRMTGETTTAGVDMAKAGAVTNRGCLSLMPFVDAACIVYNYTMAGYSASLHFFSPCSLVLYFDLCSISLPWKFSVIFPQQTH